jgi:hypothetical protein
MTRIFFNFLLTALIVVPGFSAQALEGAVAFEKIKNMAGVWQGKNKEGKDTVITYEVISGGSAVLERVEGMVTIYHMDDEKLMGTHYCEAQNQPRFVAVAEADPQVIDFRFLDITNSKPTEPHIHGVRFNFIDENKVAQHWAWFEKGQEMGMDFEFTRQK